MRQLIIPILLAALAVSAGAIELNVFSDGRPVKTPDQWEERREELLTLVTERFYGSMAPKPRAENVEVKHLSDRVILKGKARETQSIMLIRHEDQSVAMRFGVVWPISDDPVPIIIKNDRWIFDLSAMPSGKKRDQYASQKREEEFANIREMVIDRGYAVCKFVREDLAVDAKHSRKTGVLAMYPDHDWGTIAAWAWGYQPLIDYLLDTGRVDPERIIATGHSRGGKTALAAAIFDNRIAIAAPSASGSGGTGSWEHFTPGGRKQTPKEIFKNHGFWFSEKLGQVADDPGFDGHVLHALVAPRGLINTHGWDDGLANPLGTRRMFEQSNPVFKFLGVDGRAATHWRPGGHGHVLEDWRAVLDYAEAYFTKRPLPERFDNWPKSSIPPKRSEPELRRLDRADAVHTYRTVGDDELKLYAFHPKNHDPSTPRPAIVFFHGGGWRKGTPASMAPHCRYFAERGLICFTASYRLARPNGERQVQDCVQDAIAAMKWVASEADVLGVDPSKIIASGGSAGGHLAMTTALLSQEPRIAACVLFNPAAVLTPQSALSEMFNEEMKNRALSLYGKDAPAICPLTNIKPQAAPMLLMHGSKDWLLPAAKEFQNRYQAAGNACELKVWDGQDHGFYHLGKNRNRNFIETCAVADEFLIEAGLLDGKPNIEAFAKRFQ